MATQNMLPRICAAFSLLAALATGARADAAPITIPFADVEAGLAGEVTGIEPEFGITALLTGAVFTTTLSETLLDLHSGNKFLAANVQTFTLTPTCGSYLVAGCDFWDLFVSGEELDPNTLAPVGGFTQAYVGYISFDEFIAGSTTAFNVYNLTGAGIGFFADDVISVVHFRNNEMMLSPVPEPGTLLLVGAGSAVLAARRRFRRRDSNHLSS